MVVIVADVALVCWFVGLCCFVLFLERDSPSLDAWVLQVDDNWWEGERQNGEIGLFPSNYVRMLEEHEIFDNDDMSDASDGPAPKLARALFPLESKQDTDLSFAAGDIIVVLDDSKEGWWVGNLDGETGLFPSNYVECLSPVDELALPDIHIVQAVFRFARAWLCVCGGADCVEGKGRGRGKNGGCDCSRSPCFPFFIV